MLTAALENLLNRGLPRSPRARQLCRELIGTRLGVEVRGMLRLLVHSNGEVLQVTHDASGRADAELSGGLLSLLQLAGPAPEAVLQRGAVEIRGDADIARKYRKLAQLLKLDPEEELSLAIGDVPAHELGRFVRGALGWSRHAGATAVRNIAEYLAHERADLVPRAEADQFTSGVDRLREDVDRLEARIALLKP
jgi:ubiquinone biosynthesis accessory factor UbiJ